MSKNVLQTIRSRTDSFSRGQKRIADYILMNYDKAAFMTAGHLGRKAQVSESTVVRFASQLGYDGYPNMQRALQELVRGRLTSLQRIQVSRDQMQEQDVLTGGSDPGAPAPGHHLPSGGDIPQLVGQVDRTSTMQKPLPSFW